MINFCMDFICLYITARICRAVPKAYRLTAASALGALYAVFACSLEGVAAVAGALASSVIICLCAMKTESAAILIKRTAAFFISSLLLGGISYFMYSAAGKATYYNGTFYADVDAFPLILTGIVSACFILICIRKERAKLTTRSAEIRIELNGKTAGFTSLIDSGLLLCDPISADPVILVKRESLYVLTGGSAPETLPGFRLIPSDRGLLSAFRPSAIYIKKEGEKLCETAAVIGIDTSGGSFAGMDSLVPASII